MLEGPIVPALLKLAAPTLIVLVVQTLVSVAETYFVGFHESVPGTMRTSHALPLLRRCWGQS
jgi:Na+-driven multidrug efflux pump